MKTWRLWQVLLLVLALMVVSVTAGVIAANMETAKADFDSAKVVYSEHFAIAKTTDPQEFLQVREEIRSNGFIVLNEAVIRLNADQLCYIIEWELETDPFVDNNEEESWDESFQDAWEGEEFGEDANFDVEANLPEDEESKEEELRFLLLGIFILFNSYRFS